MALKSNKKSYIIAVIICAAALIGYFLIKGWHEKDPEKAINHEESVWAEEKGRLSDKIIILEKEIAGLKGLEYIEEQTEESQREEPPAPDVEEQESAPSIDEIERDIAAFFMHLDEQEYFKAYNPEGSAYNEYEASVQALSSKNPIIAGETDTLYNLFLNMAHFYRVLGKERLSLMRDVISHEGEQIESLMRSFYLWYTYEYDEEKKITGRPGPDVLYEYAAFFLNTIGGRSYLLRRDSKIRLLTVYYSVLILDRANDMKMNPHGIDIRPHIKNLLKDMSNYTGLEYRGDYLNMLKELDAGYQR